MWYRESDALLRGFEFFDKDNTKFLETDPRFFQGENHKEWILEDDERIIGFKSRKHSDGFDAWHKDF